MIPTNPQDAHEDENAENIEWDYGDDENYNRLAEEQNIMFTVSEFHYVPNIKLVFYSEDYHKYGLGQVHIFNTYDIKFVVDGE